MVFRYTGAVKKALAVFLLSLGVFCLVQPWGGFSDPDAFYHAKAAELIFQHGPIMAFPWLDLTTLGPAYVDQHFLFHVALIPFEQLLGMFEGTQVAAVVFAALFITLAYYLLTIRQARWPLFWTAILCLTPPLLQRLSLGKASPLAIGVFLIGLVGLEKRWRWGLLMLGIIYALTHAGWPLLLLVSVLMMLGEAVFDRWIFGTSWAESKVESRKSIKSFGFLLAGIVIGCLLHPNREHLLSFIWTQVFQIGVATPYGRVVMGGEWYGYDPLDLFKGLSLVVIGVLTVGYGMLFARMKQMPRQIILSVMSWSIASGCLVVLTLKSGRFAEYLVPLAVFTLATAARLVDTEKLKEELRKQPRWLVAVMVLLVVLAAGRGLIGVRSELMEYKKPFNRFDPAIAAVRSVTPAGERVFHSDWAHFPILFAKTPEYKYVAGLDPTFLLSASASLSDDYTNLTLGKTTSSAYSVIHDEFDAKTVFVEKRDSSNIFEKTLQQDKRFEEVYDDDEASVFRIR